MRKPRNGISKFFVAALILSVAACGRVAPSPAATLQAGTEERTLTIDGLERTYLLHVPAGLDASQPLALVLLFHGFQESGNSVRLLSGMDRTADSNGFLVAYPDGTGFTSHTLSWNADGCCGYALENAIDDQAFIRRIIADIGTVASVDPRRIYAAGFSNGALLTFQLACRMSDIFAAVAPVGGVLMTDPCQPQEPVSLLQVHGMNDPVVPYEGGQNPQVAAGFPPVEESLASWAESDGCSGPLQVEQEGIITHTTYGNCPAGIAVELYALEGLGHSWPSMYITDPSMNEVLWAFFAAHPKP
ncbi:MAG: prolyl oligopeptidase family serine peptidase [Anaerolineales bacterium]|nr:prolyl oligopeptidase family serine peptidase [Anaerolineales bacterium]